MVPKRIVMLAELPTGATGKPQRIGLANDSVWRVISRSPARSPEQGEHVAHGKDRIDLVLRSWMSNAPPAPKSSSRN